MIPLVDTHCHLCAGLDDGPGTDDEALEMCRVSWLEGTRWIAATAHQNERWPAVTPDQIIQSVTRLAGVLRECEIPLTLCPTAEVMVGPDTWDLWTSGQLLTIGDRGRHILIECPHGLYVDIRELVQQWVSAGVQPIVAHAERFPQLLHDDAVVEELIELGCLVQICANSFTEPLPRPEQRAMKRWVRRGLVHLLGSDGHNMDRRPPLIRVAYETIRTWAGHEAADRICSTNGLAVLQGRTIKTAKPRRLARWFG